MRCALSLGLCGAGVLCRPRVIAPTMTLAPTPMMIRSRIICPVTSSRAASALAVMSPKPTVANTVTVKYSALVRVIGWLKLLAVIVAVTTQAQMLNLLADIRDQTGVSYILISHDLAVVRQLTNEALVLHHGTVVERGPTAHILDNPQHP